MSAPPPQRTRAPARWHPPSQDLGFNGEIGYNQLLYPNEKDTRRLLQFLVQRLPKVEEEKVEVEEGPAGLLARDIGSALAAWARVPWRPHAAPGAGSAAHGAGSAAAPAVRFGPVAMRRFSVVPLAVPSGPAAAAAALTLAGAGTPAPSPALTAYETRYLAPVWRQVRNAVDLAPSLLQANTDAVCESAELERQWSAGGAGGQDAGSSAAARRAALSAMSKRAFAGFDAPRAPPGRGGLEAMLAAMAKSPAPVAASSTFAHQKEFGQEQVGGGPGTCMRGAGARAAQLVGPPRVGVCRLGVGWEVDVCVGVGGSARVCRGLCACVCGCACGARVCFECVCVC